MHVYVFKGISVHKFHLLFIAIHSFTPSLNTFVNPRIFTFWPISFFKPQPNRMMYILYVKALVKRQLLPYQ